MLPQFNLLIRSIVITRYLSSQNNLTPIIQKNSSGHSSSSPSSAAAKLSSKNPLTLLTKNIGQSIESTNMAIKQRYRSFKRKIRIYTITFIMTFIFVYAFIDHSIRTVIYEFLHEQNLSSYITPLMITNNKHETKNE
ncbi:hypothetical protein DERP_015386 [Dermatophagoides pteronyssinus]|uniref:Uncharacterized protein n=1 Tax=Dermatophagoides pteronyssinus TaxID=6956 RepID=A0ABQ8IRE7_DERPT|nr:hypothetical protein DERP_015386 [Dermatophagoides pteronyssinus]